MPIRLYLLRLIAGSLVPLILLASYLAIAQIEAIRDTQIQEATRIAHNLTMTLDRDLQAKIAALQVLSASPALDGDADPRAFLDRALPFSRESGGAIVLIGPDGQQIANTRVPFGQALPKTLNMAYVEAVLRSATPIVSDLVVGTVSQSLLAAVYVPVIRDGRVRHALVQTWEPAAIQRLLDQAHKPPGWLAGVIDGRGLFVARSHGADRFVGRPAAAPLIEAARFQRSGQVSNLSVEGFPVVNFFRTSELSSWRVVIGIPEAALNAPARRTALLLAAAALCACMVTAMVLFHGGRRLVGGVSALAVAPENAPPSGLREIDAALDIIRASNAARDHALREMLLARQAAERASASKSRFLAAASHDLRQPLQAIRLFHGVLQTRYAEGPAAQVVARLETALVAAERLLNGILDVSKIEAGVVPLRPEAITVAEMFAQLRDEVLPPAIAAGAEIRFVPSARVVVLDRVAVVRILGNLITNAMKYGGGRAVVGCRRTPDGGLRIAVVDQGAGIPESEAGSIFDEFYQIGNPERSNSNGHGLGLSIAQKLAERCGCRLGFTNRRRGCAFHLDLPPELVRDARREREPAEA